MTAGALLAFLTVVCASPAATETRLVYRMRGEARPLLFWVGRDDVGGGHIAIRRTYFSPERWREEIEVLFGSSPERIPGRVNRWGYGRESAEWARDRDTPRLLSTEFQGMMRHSAESSLAEVAPEAVAARSGRLFDVTRSVVSAQSAFHEARVFSDDGDFHYRSPDRLLARYRDCLASMSPLRRGALSNAQRAWAEPYGFLTAVSQLLAEVVNGARPRPSTTFVFNSRLYTLKVAGIRREASFRSRGSPQSFGDVAVLDFECFNTVKRTRTDFALWTPLAGELKGLPVRIRLQPRWWLRLQLDLDPAATRIASEPETMDGSGRP